MIIGGILITFVTKPWNIDVIFDFTAFFVFLLIVFFGTIIAFILYLTGVNIIGPTKASIIACIEPVAATICAILFLGVSFGFLDLIGFICIISTIFIVAYFKTKQLYKLAKNLASKTSTIQKPHSVSFSLIGFKTGITVWFYLEASFCPTSLLIKLSQKYD